MKGITTSKKLDGDTKLYRFIDFKQFISILEKQEIGLTKITEWEDTWEAPVRKLPVADGKGNPRFIEDNIYKYMYGQCWSVVGETDALWRIYSPNRDGIQIQTTVSKLEAAINVFHYPLGCLAPVVYFDDLLNGINAVDTPDYPEMISGAFLKRKAFEHEHEVRLVLFQPEVQKETVKHIAIPIDPNLLIDSILVDPRSDDWYVESLIRYCERIQLVTKPTKSDLYSDNIFNKTKIYMRYEVIE